MSEKFIINDVLTTEEDLNLTIALKKTSFNLCKNILNLFSWRQPVEDPSDIVFETRIHQPKSKSHEKFTKKFF